MTPQVTQCPSCGTSFRFTEAQLNVANGAVRCGSCLTIFQARDNALTDSDLISGEALNTAITEAADTELSSPIADDEGLGLDVGSTDDQLTADDDDYAIFSDTDGQNILDNIFDDDIFADDTSLDSLADELMAANTDQTPLTGDDSDIFDIDRNTVSTMDTPRVNDKNSSDTNDGHLTDDNELKETPDSVDLHDISQALLSLDGDVAATFIERSGVEGDSNADEDAWANKLIEDEITEEYLDPAPQELHHQKIENYDNKSLAREEFIIGNEPLVAGARFDEDKQALLASIEPEPVEFTSASRSSRWAKRAWTVSIAAAMVLLLLQYLAANFDSLARDEKYRPALTSGCSILGCTLPKNGDVSLIRSSKLLVRSHPKIQQALVVAAVLVNRADFKQPFPVIELRFTDLGGNIVAGRHFYPEEYLAGELSGRKIMPVRQPVHISLEIVDPGTQAINYELYFHSPRGG